MRKKEKNYLILPFTFLSVLNLYNIFIYTPRSEKEYKKILKQKYVVPILIYSNEFLNNPQNFKIAKTIGFKPKRMISDEEEKFLYITSTVGSNKRFGKAIPAGLSKLNLKNLTQIKGLKIYSCQGLAISKKKGVIITAGYGKDEIFVISEKDFKIIKRINTGAKAPEEIVIDEKNNKIYIGYEVGQIKVYSLTNYKLINQMKIIGAVDNLKQNKKNGNLYYTSDLVATNFAEYDKDSLKSKKERFFPFGMGFEINEEKNLAYLNDTWFGNIYLIDLTNFKTKDKIKIQPGLRGIVLDKTRNLLYIGNYATGNLHIVSLKKKKEIFRIYLGNRFRQVYITPKTKRVFAITSFGIFEIKINNVLKTIY